MAREKTRLAVQQPIIEGDGRASQHFRTWLNWVQDQFLNGLTAVGGIFNSVTVGPDEDLTLDENGIRHGDATSATYGWADITGPIETRGVPATDPAWSQIGSGPLYAFAFSIGDAVWIPFHIPHDIASSTVHFHVHWLPSGTDTRTVKWQFDYMYAKGFNQEAFDPAGATVTVEQAGPGVAYRHMVAETAGETIPTLTEPDGIVYVKLSRVTNGGSDNTDTIFVLTADLHYQSTGYISTKNKAPNFYT